MSKLRVMPSESASTVAQVLEQARKYADNGENEVTDVIVVFQQKDGTKPWFARDDAKIETLLFLVQTALFQFNCMIAGIKF